MKGHDRVRCRDQENDSKGSPSQSLADVNGCLSADHGDAHNQTEGDDTPQPIVKKMGRVAEREGIVGPIGKPCPSVSIPIQFEHGPDDVEGVAVNGLPIEKAAVTPLQRCHADDHGQPQPIDPANRRTRGDVLGQSGRPHMPVVGRPLC